MVVGPFVLPEKDKDHTDAQHAKLLVRTRALHALAAVEAEDDTDGAQ